MSAKNIALLVFALSEQAEHKKKPFLRHQFLAKSLNRYAYQIAAKSGLPVLHFDESKQQGSNFGSRFSNALQYAYQSGFDAVIAIGNDCPNLTPDHIVQAKNALQGNRNVLAPTYDGGFYLLGLAKEHFSYDAFLNFSWNTAKVFKEVHLELKQNGHSCLILEKLRDIDFLSELKKIPVNRILDRELRAKISAIIHRRPDRKIVKYLGHLQVFTFSILNKGSPLVFFT